MPSKQNLLYLTHRVPYPPDKGDRIRTYNVLRFLAKRYDVHLACLADEPITAQARAALEGLCARVAIVPVRPILRWLRAGWSLVRGHSASVGAFRSRSLVRVLKRWAAEVPLDAALASASSLAPYLRAPALRDIPAIVDLVDVDSQKWFDYARATAATPKKWLYRREGAALRRYEREIAEWAEALLLVSDAETELFRGIAPGAPVRTVTNGVRQDYFSPAGSEPQAQCCSFVGALDYRPNVDAVCWFTSEVWPLVLRTHPDARFLVVGRNPAPAVTRLAEIPGVDIIGQVPDVRPHVARSSVVVAPLRIARGLQNKVLEAMAMARPVVASPAALAGLTLDAPSPALCAQSPAEWAAHLIRLFADQEERERLGALGREYVERHYDWNRCLEPLQAILSAARQTRRAKSGRHCPSSPVVAAAVGHD